MCAISELECFGIHGGIVDISGFDHVFGGKLHGGCIDNRSINFSDFGYCGDDQCSQR